MVCKLARARKAPRDLVMRARVIELSWQRLRVPAIAAELGCSQKTVRCWLHRFNRTGLEGLEDLDGQGRKRRITKAERSRIIGLVKGPPPGRLTMQADGELVTEDAVGPPEWTLDALAQKAQAMAIDVGQGGPRDQLPFGEVVLMAQAAGRGACSRLLRHWHRLRLCVSALRRDHHEVTNASARVEYVSSGAASAARRQPFSPFSTSQPCTARNKDAT
ncbi:transposase [Streptomyces sp. NPDC002187]|uniref:helix-turn-helix domain-containing protein n=1 Tax=Streptomyces sp. NPDC002187 TaxID=3364637 RepID=UPI0036CB0E9D